MKIHKTRNQIFKDMASNIQFLTTLISRGSEKQSGSRGEISGIRLIFLESFTKNAFLLIATAEG